MSNFLEFIIEDVEAKKTLFSTMPVNTKLDIKKYNEKIAIISEKYDGYKASVKKYIDTKSKSFNIKASEENVINKLTDKVNELQHIRFILNPLNTYIEKMGFDNLLHEISNHSDLNFESLNGIINQFIDKFEQAGIILCESDFNYTCYVFEYMTSFLDVRKKKTNNYDEAAKIFEGIYWVNPEIIGHIELNFRKLIKTHEKKFAGYIEKQQKEVMIANKINNYDDCIEKLKAAYIELNNTDKEPIADIINLAKSGSFDIGNYFADSKARIAAFNDIMNSSINKEDKEAMDKFYSSLTKLKFNVKEYGNYARFLPLVDTFKAEYSKQISASDKGSKNNESNSLKNIESQIADKENKLEKNNKDIFSGKSGFFETKNPNHINQLKIESIKQAKVLYDLYKIYDKEYFKSKVLSILNNLMTVSELFHLYYSFDYYKKGIIKTAFGLTSYDEIIKYSEEFDQFAADPTNIIISGMNVFEDNNVDKIIINKYRLDNINLTEEVLNPDDLQPLLDRIEMLLRINKIEKSSTTVEKIWFMVQVEKINKAEAKKN